MVVLFSPACCTLKAIRLQHMLQLQGVYKRLLQVWLHRAGMRCYVTTPISCILFYGNTQAAKIISKTNTTQVNDAHLICVVVQRWKGQMSLRSAVLYEVRILMLIWVNRRVETNIIFSLDIGFDITKTIRDTNRRCLYSSRNEEKLEKKIEGNII